jgi:peptidoglycan/xylan/chitin deacetylase (PgdA/CDA1 family)
MGAGAAAAAAGMTGALTAGEIPGKPEHIITLSFDDGFKKSSLRTAEIYEKHGLSACINVIATAHDPKFELPNEYHAWPAGDFGLWNELKERGHEIMMHGYRHADKKELPFAKSRDLILRCIDFFSAHLKGFEPKESVFNFPFNSSTPELEEFLRDHVRSFRTGGNSINELPHRGQAKLTCNTSGPENCEAFVDGEIEKLLRLPSGWLIVNTHGLDDEGWGPIGSAYLDRLLGRLKKVQTLKVVPAGMALAIYSRS